MKFKYELSMLLVTVLWASNYVSAKVAMETYGATPNFYTAIRFCGAALILAVIFFSKLKKMSFETFKIGALIGLFVGAGYVMQTVGLTMTTASKAGFLTSLYIVLVPLFDCILKRCLPRINEFFGIVFATIGLGFLCLNGNFSMNLGDLLMLLGAVTFAISVILIDRNANKQDPVLLSIIQIFIAGIMGLLLGLFTEPVPAASSFSVPLVLLLLYAALFGSAINTTVQNIAQQKIPATLTAIIFVMEPVFAGVFGFFILQEPLGTKELLGSALIILGMMITVFIKPKQKTKLPTISKVSLT